eukprot:UN20838
MGACCMACMGNLPSDAVRVNTQDPEVKALLNNLQGEWDIIPLTNPNPQLNNSSGPVRNIAFSRAVVSGTQYTLSGGPQGRVNTQNLEFYRSKTTNR